MQNIKAEMARADMTIGDMAKALGLSRNGFSFKLNGKREYTLAELNKMADLFGVSVDYLAGRTNERGGT